jgi:hypothetical protein
LSRGNENKLRGLRLRLPKIHWWKPPYDMGRFLMPKSRAKTSNFTHCRSFSTPIGDLTSQETLLFAHCRPFLRFVFQLFSAF